MSGAVTMGLRRHSVGSRPQKSHRGLCSIPPLRSLPSSTLQNTERRSTERNPLPVTPPPSVHSGTPSQIEGGTATPLRQDHVGKTESSSSPDHQQRGMALICQTYNPQLVFENRGSTARDHLASERTFLAYVRTSLALASTGVALVQLFTIADLTSKSLNVPLGDASRKVQGLARPLGVSTVLMGLIMLIIAVYRYFSIQNSLPKNMFPVARFSVAFTTFVLTAVVIAIFGALLGGK